MRKLIMKMSISVDGFVCGPNGESDWIFKTGDEQSKAWVLGKTKEAGLIIMGRKSFESMARYWPTSTDAFAAPMNEIPKAVFTQKGFGGVDAAGEPRAASWAQARVFDGDLAEGIRGIKGEEGSRLAAGEASRLRAEGSSRLGAQENSKLAAGEIGAIEAGEGRPILALGGAGFMRSLIATGLVDEYFLITHPVVLGAGMPIFTGLEKPAYLKLVEVKVFPKGVVAHRYAI